MADGERRRQGERTAPHGSIGSSFAKRAVLAQAILILALLWSYATWRIGADRTETLESSHNELRAMAAAMYVHVQAVLNDGLGAARAAAQGMNLFGGMHVIEPAHATELLSQQLSSGEYVRTLFVASPQRFFSARRDGQVRSLDVPPSWLSPALQSDAPVYIGTTIADPIMPSKHVIPVAVRVKDASGELIWAGTLLGVEALDELYESMAARDGALSLVSTRGDLLLRVPGPSDHYPLNLSHTPVFRMALKLPPEGGVIEGQSTLAEGTWIYAFRRLHGYELAAVASRDKDGILQPWRERTRSLIFVLSGVSVVLLGLTALLRHFVQRVERANMNLAQLNTELETRVAARTTELQQANRQLALTNQELESFTTSASHDLRSPLGTIAGQAGLLREELGASLSDSARQRLDRIASSVQRSSEIIDGMLSLARISRQELLNEPVDLSALAHSITEDLRQQQPQRRVEWIIEPQLTVNADPRLMKSLLSNLLGNAWKYTSKTRDARVELSRTEVEGTPGFEVKDNGVGFDVSNAQRIFEPFQRMHAASEFPGIGLGLATVARIVQRYGGKVIVDSEPGKGAAFRFTLPAAHA